MLSGYNTHRPEDRRDMLAAIGVKSIEDLFAAVPKSLRLKRDLNLPAALSEWELESRMRALSEQNATVKTYASFLGGGAYDHHIPAVIDAIVSRGEFLTSYTPYQPEISQGLLQALFEYQTALASVTGLPVVNGSCYDGATALADAAWTCCLIQSKNEIVVADTIWPHYRQVLDTYMEGRSVTRHTVGFDKKTGQLDLNALDALLAKHKPAGFLFQTPNALGVVEDAKAIAEICQRHGVTSACSFNPIAAGIFISPGEAGIDIATCDGQALGLPLNAGGPSLGVYATRREYRKYVPGRLVGKVTDINGNLAYALVYEDREQHVARERATSNICSNQALNALRAAIFLSLLGGQGLARLATLNVNKAQEAAKKITAISGVKLAFAGPFFNEFIISLPKRISLEKLEAQRIFAGIDYSGKFGLEHALLVTVTETRSRADIDRFAKGLREALA